MFTMRKNNVATLNVMLGIFLRAMTMLLEISIVFTCCLHSFNNITRQVKMNVCVFVREFYNGKRRHNEMC